MIDIMYTATNTNQQIGKVVMNSKNSMFSNLTLKRALFLSPLLIASVFISGYPIVSAHAQGLSNPEREELAKLREQSKIKKQVQSDFEIAFTRTNTLLNIWLTILSLFPVALIAILWFFRRAIIREIVEKATQQIEGIENLQTQLTTVQTEAKQLIQESQNVTIVLIKTIKLKL